MLVYYLERFIMFALLSREVGYVGLLLRKVYYVGFII